jgi:GH18 family chitinase
MCYLASWSVYRATLGGEFRVDKVDPDLCTHIVLAFQGIDKATDKLYSRDAWSDFNIHNIGQKKNLSLKKQI